MSEEAMNRLFDAKFGEYLVLFCKYSPRYSLLICINLVLFDTSLNTKKPLNTSI